MKAFSVAWKNKNEPVKSDGRDLVTCEVCKKQGLPFPPWSYYELPILSHMYEYPFWICSDECDKKVTKAMMDKRKKELS